MPPWHGGPCNLEKGHRCPVLGFLQLSALLQLRIFGKYRDRWDQNG